MDYNNPIHVAIALIVLAIIAIAYRLYEYNRAVKKCIAMANCAESPTLKEAKPKIVVMTNEEWLEKETGCTVLRLFCAPCPHGWLQMYVEFTFLCNGYVTKSASAKAAIHGGELQWELRAKLAGAMAYEMTTHKLNWDY